MHERIYYRMLAAFLVAAHVGCIKGIPVTSTTWHEKCDWVAADYFDDPQVIALCEAIERNDLDAMKRLIAEGADVNAQGKGKMSPLLWAFPDNKLERFKLLLENGADPNVIIESDFNTRGGMSAGDSVTHMVCKTAFSGYFEAVFKHGGDPNLERTSILGSNDTPLFTVIQFAGNKKAKIKQLIELGTNINHQNANGTTPTMLAVGWGGQYDIALMILKAGADHRIYKPMSNSRLIHQVLAEERRSPTWTPQQRADYEALLQWLIDHGESLEEANADRERWKSWSATTGEYRRKMDAEIAQRKAREARAAEEKPDE
jgi:uncharacterized protein